MAIKKVGKIWYFRHTIGRNENLISTHQTERRKAVVAAERISATFEREKQAKRLSCRLIDVVKEIAKNDLQLDESLRGALASIERDALADAWNTIDDIFPAPPLLASELWEKYLKSAPDLKPSTLRTKKLRFGKFIAWAADMDMREVKEKDCRTFLDSLESDKSQTLNNYVSDLSSVWKQSPALLNPWGEHLRQKSNVMHKQAFSRDQVKRILEYCKKNNFLFWHSAVLIAYYTGLRLKDVVFLNRACLTKDNFLSLIPQKTARTGKSVRIPLSHTLRDELMTWPVDNSLYFFPEMVSRYEAASDKVSREFRKILESCNLYSAGFGFHSLRHTFVTEAMNAGIEIKHIQAVVGHDAIELTEGTYYHGEKHADLSAYPAL